MSGWSDLVARWFTDETVAPPGGETSCRPTTGSARPVTTFSAALAGGWSSS